MTKCMSRLIESIRLQNGSFHRLHYHQSRVNRAMNDLHPSSAPISLTEYLSTVEFPKKGIFKCRIVYEHQIDAIEFIPYEIKSVQSLKVVYDHTIDYEYKYEDRNKINLLVEQRQFCDDILIIKNGFVTDSSYSNIIFFDGFRWITPDTPLLRGTMRQFLLDTAEIKQEPITVQDILSFKSFRLINAMLGFDGPEIEVSRIVL